MTAVAYDDRWPEQRSWRSRFGTNTTVWGADVRLPDSGATAFDLNRSADWLPDAQAKLREYQALPGNWDGHGGRSLKPDVAYFAMNLLAQTTTAHTPAPHLVPLSYGGLQIEWHTKGIDLEIEVTALGQIYASCQDDRDARNNFADEFSSDLTIISKAIGALTTRR